MNLMIDVKHFEKDREIEDLVESSLVGNIYARVHKPRVGLWVWQFNCLVFIMNFFILGKDLDI